MTYISNKNFYFEVAKGNVAKHSVVDVFGRNPDIDNGVTETVWKGSTLYTFQTSAQTLSVVSTSTNDDGNPTSNTGAQTLTIQGLDSSWDILEETITLDGTTPVTTSGSFIRVNKAFVATTGTYHDSNLGTVSCTFSSTADTAFSISAGEGETELGFYSVPNGYTGYLLQFDISVDANKPVNFTTYKYTNADDTSQPFSGAKRIISLLAGIAGSQQHTHKVPIVLASKTDIETQATATVNNTQVECRLSILLVQD